MDNEFAGGDLRELLAYDMDAEHAAHVFASPTAIDFSNRPLRAVLKEEAETAAAEAEENGEEKREKQKKEKNGTEKTDKRLTKIKKLVKRSQKEDADAVMGDGGGAVIDRAQVDAALTGAEEMDGDMIEAEAARIRGDESGDEEEQANLTVDAVNRYQEPSRFTDTLTSVSGKVKLDADEIQDLKLKEADKNWLNNPSVRKGPNAIVLDKPASEKTARQDEKVRKLSALERKLAMKKEVEAAKDLAEALKQERDEKRARKAAGFADENADGSAADDDYSDGDDDDTEDDEDGDAEGEVTAANSKKVDTTTNAAASALASSSLAAKVAAKARAASKPAASAVAEMTDAQLMPQLLYLRVLPPSLHAKIDSALSGLLQKNANLSDEERRRCEEFTRTLVSQGLMLVEATTNNAKDTALLAASEEISTLCGDDYSVEKMRSIAKQANKQRCWLAESQKGVRRDKNGTAAPNADAPRGIRPVDWAYTKWCIKNIDRYLPVKVADILANKLLAMVLRDAANVAHAEFRVTADDHARVTAETGDAWICAATGREIKVGSKVLCIGGMPSALKFDMETHVAELRKSIKKAAFAGFGISTYEQYFASDLAKPEIENAPFYAFILMNDPVPEAAAKTTATKKNDAPTDVEMKDATALGKRERDSDNEGGEDGAAGDKPQAAKRIVVPRTELLPIRETNPMTSYDLLRAPLQDADTVFEIDSNSRSHVVTSVVGMRNIAAGYYVALNDQVVELLNRAKSWLLKSAQHGVFETYEDEFKSNPIAQSMLDDLFGRAGVFVSTASVYTSETPNTAALLLARIEKMQQNRKMDPISHSKRSMYDERLFGEWLTMILLSFTHPTETISTGSHGPFQRDAKEDKALAKKAECKMRLNEVPFGRQLTTNPMRLQFVRLVVECLYTVYVKPLVDNLLASDGVEEEKAALEELKTFSFDSTDFAQTFVCFLRNEIDKMEEVRGKTTNVRDEKELKDILDEYANSHNVDIQGVAKDGTVVGGKKRDRRTIMYGHVWTVIRKGLLEQTFPAETKNSVQTALFVGDFFPVVF